MHRHTNQRGAALILLIGITATLAMLSATLVFVIQNQQGATASERSSKQSLYVGEAALDSAVQVAKATPSPMPTESPATEWLSPTDLATAFGGAFPPGATVTYRVYDNLATVDYATTWDSSADGMMWVEATATYQGKTTRARALVRQAVVPFAAALPAAVTYSDTGIMLRDHSDIYAVNADGSADTSGSPFATAISAGGTWTSSTDSGWAEVGRFTMNAYSDLAAPGGTTQSLGIKANGSVSLNGTVYTTAGAGHQIPVLPATARFTSVTIAPGTVGFLSDYFDQKAQAALADESQEAYPVQANSTASATSTPYTNFRTSRITTNIPGVTYDSTTMTYTFANDIIVTGGDLTLNTSGTAGSQGVFPAGTKFNFKSLYTDNSLAVTGQITLNTTDLYVGSNFTLTGPTSSSAAITDSLGSVFVRARPTSGIGDVKWNGYVSVSSRDYLNPTADPQPMWLGQYWERRGTYDDEYGKIWVPGNSGTSVSLRCTYASTIMCPLLCTTERTEVSGPLSFGTRTQPMVYFFMCDNNGIYPQVVDWASTGTYYGLMVINESTIDITNGVSGTPSIEGAVFAGCPYDPTHTSGMSKSDIVLEDYSTIAFNETVVGAIESSSLKTTTMITQIVPGSWQQLPVN